MHEEEATFWVQVGQAIRALRRGQSMSVDTLAARVHVSRQQIVRLEAGISGTPLGRLHDIAEALGVSLGDLLPSKTRERATDQDMAMVFRGRGLSPDEIQKVLDYISLLESARKRD